MSEQPEPEFKPVPIWTSARRHPVIAGILVSFTIAGAVLGGLLLTDDWSLARRLAAGGVAGTGFGLLLTVYRIIG